MNENVSDHRGDALVTGTLRGGGVDSLTSSDDAGGSAT